MTIFKNSLTEESLKNKGLNNRQIEAVFYIKENKQITNSVYRSIFNVSEKTAFRDFEKLVELGILKKEGERKGTVYKLNVR